MTTSPTSPSECQLSEIREIVNEYLQIEMCESGKVLRDDILGVLLQEYTIVLDNNGKPIKMCKEVCSCHSGARYDQIECRCHSYCGDEVQ